MSDKITIQGELYSSKNSKQILALPKRRPFLVDASWVKKNEKVLRPQLVAMKPEWDKMVANLAYPLPVRFKIYRRTRGRFDYTNIIQQIADMMVKCDWLPDDNANYFRPVFCDYEVDKENPRVEIDIEDRSTERVVAKTQMSLL